MGGGRNLSDWHIASKKKKIGELVKERPSGRRKNPGHRISEEINKSYKTAKRVRPGQGT